MKMVRCEASCLAMMGLVFAIPAVLAMPQRTAFANTTSIATPTTVSPSASTTPGPSLSRKCGFWLPNEIFLNSWWTEHATFTVATEVDYYIQYNNTIVPANSSTRYEGFTGTFSVTSGANSGKVYSSVFTDFEYLATTGLLASMQWGFPGVPTDLISLLPAGTTTTEYTYAMSRFHTYSEITTEWGLKATRTNTVVASPTPFVEPILGLLFVAYGQDTSEIRLEDYNFTNLETLEYTGGLWLEPDVDWPSKVMFDSVPIEYINWVYDRNPNISSEYPWLGECTNFVSKQPTGAPTVHIVATTLTHKTSSIIATSPGNFGGVVPTSNKVTSKQTSKVETSEKEKSTSAVLITVPTSGQTSTTAEKTSTAVAEQESTLAVERPSTSTADQGSPTTVQQVSSTGVELVSTSNVQQPTSGAGQVPSGTGGQAPTSADVSEAPTSEATGPNGASSESEAKPTLTTTDLATNGAPSSTVSKTTSAGTTGVAVTTAQSSAAEASSAAQPVNNESSGVSSAFSGTTAVSKGASSPSTTTNDGGSNDATQVSSAATIPTNHQAVTSGGFTETQQLGTTTNEVPGATAVSQELGTSQVGSVVATTSSGLVGSSSASETTVLVASILTLGPSTISANPSSEYVISSQTLAPGGPAITIGETTYSLATSASAIVENGQTQSLTPVVSTYTVPQITLGSSVVVESQTISAGGSAITAGGTTYSVATSGSATFVVENGDTQQPEVSQTAAPVITLGSSVVTANSASAYVVGSQTLEADGSAIAIGETTYSLATSAFSTFVVQNGVTSALSAVAEMTTAAPAITIGSSVVTADAASGYVIGTQTLAPGSSAVEVQGTTYSLATSGPSTYMVENGLTSALPVAAPSTTPVVSVVGSAAAPVITVGSSIVTANSASEFVIGSLTLAAGSSAITEDGTTYSLAPSATAVIINGATSEISASQTSAIIVAGQTLSLNSAIEVQGTTYSLAPSGTAVVINGETSPLPPATFASPLTFASALATPVSSGYIIGSQTLSPGAEITVGGTTYSLAAPGTAIVIDGSTRQLLPQSTLPTLFAIGSTTLSPGNAVTVGGTTYSIPTSVSGGASGEPVVVVDGKTSTLLASGGLGAAVISGLQGTSLSGSRTVGGSSVTTTSAGASGSGFEVGGSSSAAASTAGAAKQTGVLGSVVAMVVGAIGVAVI